MARIFKLFIFVALIALLVHPVSAQNLALGKTPTYTNCGGLGWLNVPETPGFAVDGDYSTTDATGTSGDVETSSCGAINIDLGANENLNYINVKYETVSFLGATSSVVVQSSQNNLDWNTLNTQSGGSITNNASFQITSNIRYIRLLYTHTNGLGGIDGKTYEIQAIKKPWWNVSSLYRINTSNVTRYGTVSLNLTNSTCVSNSTWICGNGLFNYSFVDNYTVQTNIHLVNNDSSSIPIYFRNISGATAIIYTNYSTLENKKIYINQTNRTFNNSRVCVTPNTVFRFCDDGEGSTLAGNFSAAVGTLTKTGNGYIRYVSNSGNFQRASSAYSPDAAGSWAVLAEVGVESTVDGYSYIGQTGTDSSGSGATAQISFGNTQGNASMITHVYSAAATDTGFTTAANFWDQPTRINVEVRKTPGTVQASIYTLSNNFVESKTTTTNVPNVTNPLGLYNANNLPQLLYWFAVADYNSSESAFGTWGNPQSLYLNTFTSNQTLNFTIPPGYPAITFWLNSTTDTSNSSCNNGLCPWWRINGVTNSSAHGSPSMITSISTNTTITGTTVDSTATATTITWIVNVSSVPTLIYPTNGTMIVTTFPPISSDVNFTWYDISNSHIQVASDSNFNLLLLNATTSNQYYSFSLTPGTYYWRVQHSDSSTGVVGDYSNPESFTITASSAALPDGANLQGVIYETINGVIYPISGAIITVTNSSLYNSNSTKSASNGYYLVTGLSNFTTYSITVQASGYDSPNTAYFTTNNTTITMNFELNRCTSTFNCYFDANFVRFHVQNMFGKVYSGVTISAYLGSSTTTTITGDTDSTGSVDFLLSKQNLYRITFISASQGINTTWTLYPKEDYYTLVVNGINNFEDCAAKNISTSATDLNATHQRLNLNYSDPSGTTTRINFTVYYANNRTVYATQGNVVASTWNTYIDVPMGNATTGVEYIYGYNSSLNVCSEIGSYKAIIFPPLGGKLIDIGLSDGWLQTISIILIVTIGALFGARNVSQGAISVSLAGMFFTVIGWFRVANFPAWSTPGNAALSWSILMSCLVISLILHMRKREVSNI